MRSNALRATFSATLLISVATAGSIADDRSAHRPPVNGSIDAQRRTAVYSYEYRVLAHSQESASCLSYWSYETWHDTTSEPECREAAASLSLSYGGVDSDFGPPGCYQLGDAAELNFNPNTAAALDCGTYAKCVCSRIAGTYYLGFSTSGTCETHGCTTIASQADCDAAAAAMRPTGQLLNAMNSHGAVGLDDTSSELKSHDTRGQLPHGCAISPRISIHHSADHLLTWNPDASSHGTCSSHDQCICKCTTSMAPTQAPGPTAAPTDPPYVGIEDEVGQTIVFNESFTFRDSIRAAFKSAVADGLGSSKSSDDVTISHHTPTGADETYTVWVQTGMIYTYAEISGNEELQQQRAATRSNWTSTLRTLLESTSSTGFTARFNTAAFAADSSWSNVTVPSFTTPSPTRAPTGGPTAASTGGAPKQISQAITFTGVQASDYAGDVKTTYEAAYAVTIGIWDSSAKAMRPGCSVASSVTSRRATTVTFEATVTDALATTAQSAADALITDVSAMVTGINIARNDLSTTSTVVAMSSSDMTAAPATVTTAPPDNSNSCLLANDGECDEPWLCASGTDSSDCSTTSSSSASWAISYPAMLASVAVGVLGTRCKLHE